MFFIIQCGGIPFDGDTIKNRSLGGSETAAYYVAKELAAAGHRVTAFTNCQQGGIYDGVRYEPMGRTTQEMPFGENFHYYATNTPHDVLIMQRHPKAFSYRWGSKINLWWLHDLALYRSKSDAISQIWNVDRVLTVSEYHRQQVSKVYGIDAQHITNIRNGVDQSLFSLPGKFPVPEGKRILTYTSRPERGLDHLVRPGGIMERLGGKYQLMLCGYENTTPQMEGYYNQLWQWADKLDNVTNLGALTKADLAELLCSADLHVYPTAFEEVSCITAMECMAAALPMITSRHAALPETCRDAGVMLVDLKDGSPDEDAFVEQIESYFASADIRKELTAMQAKAAKQFTWKAVATNILEVVGEQLAKVSASAKAVGNIEHSQIVGFNRYSDLISGTKAKEVADLYQPWFDDVAAHYATRTEPLYRANVTSTARFQHVARQVKGTESLVVDWGCNAGHFTIPLAAAHPGVMFVGVDFDEKAVEFAREWAREEGLDNIHFTTVDDYNDPGCDLLILCEVLEHAPDIYSFWDKLPEANRYIISTPYGPWESLSYAKMGDYREHVHHFERQDLHELFGHCEGFRVLNVPHPTGSQDLKLGSYITEFNGPAELGEIDYQRKERETVYRQTVSACILLGSSEETLLKCLRSLEHDVDELVLRIGSDCNDATMQVMQDFFRDCKGYLSVQFVKGAPPTEIGFDAARNETVQAASGDWILWIDTDEVLQVKDGWKGLLKSNPLNGYAIPQHHFSADPPAVIKVDYPCRLFRKSTGAKFFGVVHEHPEIALNEGMGQVQLTRLIEIMHYGYKSEGVRRARFERNFTLLEQDRQKHPERKLGAMLWLRDCGQRIQYKLETNGGRLTAELEDIARDGIKTFEWMLDNCDLRMICDSLEFYSVCAETLGPGIEAAMAIGVSEIPNGMPDSVPTHKGIFYSRDHINRLAAMLLDQGKDIDRRYF